MKNAKLTHTVESFLTGVTRNRTTAPVAVTFTQNKMLSLRSGSRGFLISGQRLLSTTPSRLTESSSTDPPQQPKKTEPEPVTLSKPSWDNSNYQVPEYYQHTPMSFFDLDVEMASKRLPQPSSLKQ